MKKEHKLVGRTVRIPIENHDRSGESKLVSVSLSLYKCNPNVM